MIILCVGNVFTYYIGVEESELINLFIDGTDDENDELDFQGFESVDEEPTHLAPVNDAPLLVGITTDGASVLTGRRNGVQKKIKEACNNLLTATHCLSHRLQLAIKDSAVTLKELHDLQHFCEQLFIFHRNSAVVSAVYRNACKVFTVKG